MNLKVPGQVEPVREPELLVQRGATTPNKPKAGVLSSRLTTKGDNEPVYSDDDDKSELSNTIIRKPGIEPCHSRRNRVAFERIPKDDER